MMNVGLWQRPRAYREAGETLEQAYVREARAVRASVGITDVSTLGKIDVQGPDAAIFLDRVYTNTFSTLPVGKARYGLMLRDDGFLYDDGTTWRLSDNRYLMTTTTANAALVYQNLEMLLAIAWPELRVSLASLTDQWAGVAVAGPNSRALLRRRGRGYRHERRGAPLHGRARRAARRHSGAASRGSPSPARWPTRSIAARTTRSLSGTRLLEAGRPFEVVPYGLEALGTLRIEKGHVTGAEIDGRTSVHDLGLEKMFSMKKDFVGKPLALRPALTDPSRKQLVGLDSLDGKAILGGAHLVRRLRTRRSPGRSRATSPSCATARRWSLYRAGLLERGRARHGEMLYAADPVRGRHAPVEFVDACFVRSGAGAACMAERRSALADLLHDIRERAHDLPGSSAMTLHDMRVGSVVHVAAWPDTVPTVEAVIRDLLGLEPGSRRPVLGRRKRLHRNAFARPLPRRRSGECCRREVRGGDVIRAGRGGRPHPRALPAASAGGLRRGCPGERLRDRLRRQGVSGRPRRRRLSSTISTSPFSAATPRPLKS